MHLIGVVMIVWQLDLQLHVPVQLKPITTNFLCLNPPINKVYVKSSWSMSNFQNFVYNVQ
jgi:hypothetical protein